jgi:hypothetical protein
MNTIAAKMTMKNSSLLLLVLLAAATRILPHPPNMTAVCALAILTGVAIESRLVAVFVPLFALFLSDLLLGFHDQMWAVYFSMALITFISAASIGKTSLFATEKLKILGVTLTSSLLFFVITNLAVWWQSPMYQHNLEGLTKCFVMALPFLGNQIVGDLFYAGIFLTAFAVIARRATSLEGRSFQSR